jgi:hypothetical protein
MQDLTGFGILGWDYLLRLGRCQICQHPSRNAWIHPETFQGCDDAIAPEHCAKPRDTCIGVQTVGGLADHHV